MVYPDLRSFEPLTVPTARVIMAQNLCARYRYQTVCKKAVPTIYLCNSTLYWVSEYKYFLFKLLILFAIAKICEDRYVVFMQKVHMYIVLVKTFKPCSLDEASNF